MRLGRQSVGRLRLGAILTASCAASACLLVLAPQASARTQANLSLDVIFNANGSIAVTLPDGTPVGSSSGTPTVIPAGFYSLLLTGPGGCAYVPYFNLQGPGVNITDNMDEGEMASSSDGATFQPNSTYTWSDAGVPSVVYTFTTSSQVLGTAPPSYTSGSGELTSASHSTSASQDLVGSESAAGSNRESHSTGAAVTGSLTGSVSEGGRVSLVVAGKPVTRLKPGRYTLSVSDASAGSGYLLEKLHQAAVTVTGTSFVGRRTVSIDLTPGTWYLLAAPSGAREATISVG